MTVKTSSNLAQLVDLDIQRHCRLNFSEFVVFMCFIANETYADYLEGGFPIPFTQRLRKFMTRVMKEFGLEWDSASYDGMETIVGIDVIEKILVNERVQDLVPLTPDNEVVSYYPDMYSAAGDLP